MNPKLLALICAGFIAILEGIALLKGIDGKCLAICAALIGGLGGYGIREITQILKR